MRTPQAGSPRPGGGPTGGREGNFVERILIKIADERFSARGLERRATVCGSPFQADVAIHIVKCNIMMADVANHIVKCHIMLADVAIPSVKCKLMLADVAIHIVKCNIMKAGVALRIVKLYSEVELPDAGPSPFACGLKESSAGRSRG